MRARTWTSCRSRAIEAYKNLPGLARFREGDEELEEKMAEIPALRGKIYSYPCGPAGIPVESQNASDLSKKVRPFLVSALKERFGIPSRRHENHYFIEFSDSGTMVFFVEENFTTKGKGGMRLRMQFFLEHSIRKNTLTLYPKLIVYEEQTKSPYLLYQAVGTVAGTPFFPPLPFLLLGYRFFVSPAMNFMSDSRVKKISPGDIADFNPSKLDDSNPWHRQIKTWSSERFSDIEFVLNELVQHLSSMGSGSGITPQRRKMTLDDL